jgi:hypothetical protein
MKVQDLIQALLPFKDENCEVVIVDNGETLVSRNIEVCLMPDNLIDNPDNKYVSAIADDNDNVVGQVVYIELNDFYMEEDYWKNKKCDQ